MRSCRRCRLDCAEAELRMTKFREVHQEFVPKSDYIALQKTHDELMTVAEQLKQNFRNTKVEYK